MFNKEGVVPPFTNKLFKIVSGSEGTGLGIAGSTEPGPDWLAKVTALTLVPNL